MVENKIIEPMNEPAPAVSPMVVVWKNKKPLICIDLTDVNKNIKRRQYPLQTIDEVAANLHGSKIYSKLDCAGGFCQIKVSRRTSNYLTFSTPWGRFRTLRLPFGLSSAPEVFQAWMSTLLGGKKGVEVAMDDILCHARNKEELEIITQDVLNTLKKAGLKLNPEKCIFNTPKVVFLGHVISEKGIEADPEKVASLEKFKIPENVNEL